MGCLMEFYKSLSLDYKIYYFLSQVSFSPEHSTLKPVIWRFLNSHYIGAIGAAFKCDRYNHFGWL
jgi:hypothetical protein